MKIVPVEQGSVDWMLARAGIPTASEFDQLLTPEFKIRSGEMPRTYLAKKVAEKWLGAPLPASNVFDMDQGQILEQEAKPFYELQYGEQIRSVGFITSDDGTVGCSPDGLLGDDCGIEIKCPAIHTHLGYLLSGQLPKEYAAQVHGAMFVTERPRWKFLSYRRHFPPLLVTVERDEEIQSKIAEAITRFTKQMEVAMKFLEDLNGGPPKRAAIYARMESDEDSCEVIP